MKSYAPSEKSGGGTLKETTLWINPSPTTAMNDGTMLTLSENIENFEFIKVYARLSTSDSTEVYTIMSLEEYLKTASAQNKTRLILCGVVADVYARLLRYSTQTEIRVGRAQITGSSTTNNSVVIPTRVIGLK